MKLLYLLAFIVCGQYLFSQTGTQISGIVVSEGEPLTGATVKEKGTANAVVTDVDGRFAMTVRADATLEISYLGYETGVVRTAGRTSIRVELREAINQLTEVVAIGYGVQQKKLLTGATLQIKGSDITRLNTVSALGALQSQTPGVNIVKLNGKPGEGFKVTVRGLGTIGNSTPLYIIDGVPNGDINNLNPSDIESVDVLKDAASAAIYGARAANGVILITTKQGEKGKTLIQYDGYLALQSIAKKATPLNAVQYLDIMKEAGYDRSHFEANIPGAILEGIDRGTFNGTNWLDEMICDNAPMQSHALNIISGNDRSTYSFGSSYTRQEPIIGLKNAETDAAYERLTVRLNSEHKLLKRHDDALLSFGQTLTMAFVNKDGLGMGVGNMYWNDVRNALLSNPLLPLHDENGRYHAPLAGLDYTSVNPVAEMDYKRSRVNSKNYSARGNFYLTLQPAGDLKLRTNFGYAFNGWSSREYIPVYTLNTVDFSEMDKVTQGAGNGLQWSWDNTLTYDFKSAAGHKITAMIGNSIEKWGLGEDLNGSNFGSEFNTFEFAYLSNVKTVSSNTSLTGTPWSNGGIVSFFARANYDYAGRYMASAVIRADGSSNFARGNRWGYFPSFSAGWNLSEEDFLKDKNLFDQLKLRASWGENGNCNIPAFRYLGSIAFGNMTNSALYYFGTNKENYSVGSYPDIIPNEDLKWETSRQFNIGLDIRMLDNRLGLTLDGYNKTTVDWLVKPTGLGIWGTGAPYINGGDVRNSGLEALVAWDDRVNDFAYGLKLNMACNKNEVLKIANQDKFINGTENILSHATTYLYRAEEGYPIGYFRGYQTLGIFQNDAEIAAYTRMNPETGVPEPIMPAAKLGDVIFADRNNDGKISDDDKTMIGNPHPDVTYGLSINLAYRGFDLAVTGYGVAGNQIAKSYRNYTNKPFDNYTTEILDRWHGEGTSNRLPAINGSSINYAYISDLYIEDGDYFRITNLTAGYDLRRLFRSEYISQLRIYATVQNLFTFTRYSGMDPEVGYNAGDSWASGIDLGYYPGARTYMVGCNIKF
jgi:TonB-linked SusC/RagA family outer membrane protein